MAQIIINLTEALSNTYKRANHPLGKNRRGRKKWLKRFIVKAIINFCTRKRIKNA